MKLVTAHVKNFRSVLDSNPVEIGDTTCLVGKNEAGKTAFLKALEGLRSVDRNYKQYGKTESYPRRFLAEYDERHPSGNAVVIETSWELEDSDKKAVCDELGEGALTGSTVQISKGYEQDGSNWVVPIDQKAVLQRLIGRFDLSKDEAAPISDAATTVQAAGLLEELEEPTEAQSEMLQAIQKYRDNSAILKAIDILNPLTPRFLYFSHYDRMAGALAINKLKQDQQQDNVEEGDQVFLDFLEYAGTTLEELHSATRFEELNAKCEGAANRITDQIFDYWTQNDQLSIEVELDMGLSEDEPPFNSGPIARARVRNSIHRVSVPFSERSAGFVWFFSFLVKFAQIKKQQGNVIILLDEPGLTLHGTAQKDLLRYFEEQLEPKHQVIYSTHSPFMVPADNLACVRTVEDVVSEDQRGRKVSEGTKVRSDVMTTDPQTNFPLLGAMGYEVTQGLVIKPDTLLVEGPSDILYLQAVSSKLKVAERTHLHPKWAVCPAGGIDKVLPFVRLFHGNGLNMVILTDFDRGQKRKLENLHKAELLEEERVILATEIADQDEADIEDFFTPEFFVELVNATYSLEGKDKLTVKKLNDADTNTNRMVKKAEAYFRTLPDSIPMFSHYDPALFLLQNPQLLDGRSAAVTGTLDRFELAFKRISNYE
ncbi:ATP-dependent endonuclease [Ruegeria sp. Ofav3-42]|uniref:ATP-dependent nuclease n=1 Tax=Ruegeria sp. Ofav3-42 TaxID=2917759 RepID=UPI001EF53C27|nr:AAA family ATPase [Ruegeria sp. Ofav3-42]MCG7518443.1 AAA family ATPase [Ruegeria sp. Ofav3-42]